jgi:RNA polymerase sigma factor (sigma-70 family)
MSDCLPVTIKSGAATSCGPERDAVDLAILSRLQSGDSAAYGPLWDRYWPWLCTYFRSQLGNKEEAEDLAGATMLAAFEQLGRFRGQARHTALDTTMSLSDAADLPSDRCTFKTYLGAIARHKLARYLRQRIQRRCRNFTELYAEAFEDDDSVAETLPGGETDANPLRNLLLYERQEETFCALAYVGLRSNEQFKALLFHYVCGLAHREIADILGLRDETVNTRLQEGRRKLGRFYQAMNEETATIVC